MLLTMMRQKQLRLLGLRILTGRSEMKARLRGLADDRSDVLSTADALAATCGGIDRLSEPARVIYATLKELYEGRCGEWAEEDQD